MTSYDTNLYKKIILDKNLTFPKNYWNKEIAKDATIWLIEEKLKWDDEQIKHNLCTNTFKENGLLSMLYSCFNGSVFSAINNAYPGKFHEWELRSVPRNFWNKDTAKRATIWLIEDKLKWDDEQIKNNLCKKTFVDNGLASMLKIVFNDSVFLAFDNAYPNRFKYWEFKAYSKNYWNKENAREATIWLIEEKLKWNDEDICRNLSKYTFIDNGLYGMLRIFNSSPFLALNNAYPGKFHEWELKSVPRNFWNKDTAREATIWLIEDKLKWNDKQVKNNLCIRTFIENGLYGMLVNVFKGITFLAIDNAYPGRFNKNDFK